MYRIYKKDRHSHGNVSPLHGTKRLDVRLAYVFGNGQKATGLGVKMKTFLMIVGLACFGFSAFSGMTIHAYMEATRSTHDTVRYVHEEFFNMSLKQLTEVEI